MAKKRLIGFLILIVGFCLIISLSRDIWRLLRSSGQIRQAENELQTLQKENQVLSEKKGYYQSEEFIEEEVRNKLNMSRPGEVVVILPPNVEKLVGRVDEGEFQETPNWKKWWELFF